MKQSIYLDTSVLNAYYDERKPERQKITQLWWKSELQKYEVVISKVTIDELGRTKNLDKRTKFLDLVNGIKVLPVIPDCEMLADKYLEANIVPSEFRNDALHIAIASVNRIDIIVSWNFEHMVNHETRLKVKAVNLLNGYPEISIESPEELGGAKYV